MGAMISIHSALGYCTGKRCYRRQWQRLSPRSTLAMQPIHHRVSSNCARLRAPTSHPSVTLVHISSLISTLPRQCMSYSYPRGTDCMPRLVRSRHCHHCSSSCRSWPLHSTPRQRQQLFIACRRCPTTEAGQCLQHNQASGEMFGMTSIWPNQRHRCAVSTRDVDLARVLQGLAQGPVRSALGALWEGGVYILRLAICLLREWR